MKCVLGKKVDSDTVARVGKLAWYALLTVLVLTLPTYSYLVPRYLEKSEQSSSPNGTEDLPPATQSSVSVSSVAGADSPRALVHRHKVVRTGERSGRPPRKGEQVSDTSGAGGTRIADRSQIEETGGGAIARQDTSTALPGRAAAASAARAEMGEIESALEQAEDYLFAFNEGGVASGFSVNPFRLALRGEGAGGLREERSAGDDSTANDPTSNPTGGDDSSEAPSDTNSENPSGNEGDPTDGNGGTSPEDTSEDTPEETPQFPFLYVGALHSEGSVEPEVCLAAPADRGRIFTEDGRFVGLFNSLVSVSQPFVARTDEMAYTDDLNGDRVEDFTLYGVSGFVGFVEAYSRAFRQGISFVRAFFPFEAPISVAAHDFDSDGDLEMGVIFEGSKNLFVYEFTEDSSLRYVKEMVLPFYPAVLVSTRSERPVQQQYLHVLDASLKKSVYFSARYAGIYSFGSPSTRKKVQKLFQPSEREQTDETQQDCQYLLLWYEDRVVIGGCDDERFSLIGSFDLSRGIPTILVGRYFEENEEYLYVWP